MPNKRYLLKPPHALEASEEQALLAGHGTRSRKTESRSKKTNLPAWGNKAVEQNAKLQRHVLVIHIPHYGPKLHYISIILVGDKIVLMILLKVCLATESYTLLPSMQSVALKDSPFGLCSWLNSTIFLLSQSICLTKFLVCSTDRVLNHRNCVKERESENRRISRKFDILFHANCFQRFMTKEQQTKLVTREHFTKRNWHAKWRTTTQ